MKIIYVSESLPNSITGGSDLFALNLLEELKKKINILVVSIGGSHNNKNELSIIKKNLKKKKIKFIEFKKRNSYLKKPVKIYNFYKKNYINEENIYLTKRFIDKLDIKKDDIVFAYGCASILASSDIKCFKIALIEDIQDKVFILREYQSINKFNFFKKITKLIMLNFHFRGYYAWLKSITKNYNIKYTFSNYDFFFLKKYINDISILKVPFKNELYKKKIKKQKFFNISMFSSSMSQDYNGIELLYNKLIPDLKKNNLYNNIKINLVMRKPKFIPINIKKIINDKKINIYNFNDNIIKSTDLLFYPSKYPVGFRSKILYAFSKGIFVATSSTMKKCIPELKDLKNCIMSNNIDELNKKIIMIIKNPEKFKFIIKRAYKTLKIYSTKLSVKKIQEDILKFKS